MQNIVNRCSNETRLLVPGRSKTARTLKVSGAVKTLKKIKCNKKISLKFENFLNENHPLRRHIKYKRLGFAPCNKSILANKLLSINLERFLTRFKSPLTH